MSARPAPLLAALLASALLAAGALAALPRTLADERARLVSAKAQAETARIRSRMLERQAELERDEAARTRAQATAIAARVQLAEADITAAESRVAIIGRLQRDQRARLAARQRPIVKLIAALQALTRRPTVVALIQPGSVSDLVHVRAVLATVMPVVVRRTAGLRADLERARALGKNANTALKGLEEGRSRLQRERTALAQIEAAQNLRARQLGQSAMFESDRATALGEEARDIVDLMGALGAQSQVRESLATLTGPVLRPDRPDGTGAPTDTPPLPRRAAAYRLPVIGQVVTGLGEVSAAGVRSRGLTIAASSGAQVVVPTTGRIAFAGPFRGYGTIIIIDHGQGWTSLITNLASTTAAVGDTVSPGAPIGRAADADAPRITVELRHNGRPVDMTPLLG